MAARQGSLANGDSMSEAPLIAEGLYSYQIGGSERVGVDLATEFARRGYRVMCLAFYDSEGPMRTLAESAGIRCLDFNYLKRRWGIRRLTYQVALWNLFRRERVHALHVHHATALILSGLPAWAAGVDRVVMTEHALHQFIAEPSYRSAATRYCRLADAVTLIEPQQVDYFRDELSVPIEKLHHISNGTAIRPRDSVAGSRVRSQIGVAPDTFVVLFAGRLHPIKDLSTLLRAASLLPPEVRQTLRIVIAGDGPERERLEHERRALGIESTVLFLGARDDVGMLLQAADAFVMTSISEGLPMALLEAMASGVPCIATAVGGIPALFAGDAGVLVPVGDPRTLAGAIVRMIEDVDHRTRLAQRGLARIVERHSLDDIVTQYLTVLGLPPRWTDKSETL